MSEFPKLAFGKDISRCVIVEDQNELALATLALAFTPPRHMMAPVYKKKEAIKCRLPSCEVMHLHNGGYCCAEHFRKHKGRVGGGMSEIDHSFTDEIVCPHCGYKFHDSWELNDQDGTKQDCAECGEEFELAVNFEVTYSTYKKEAQCKKR